MSTAESNGRLNGRARTLMSVFGLEPKRIGGTEMFARELSKQLAERGWLSVLCFLSEPKDEVRAFLSLPNVSFESLPNSTNGNFAARMNLMGLMAKHHPQILHLHYVSFISLYPWAARLKSVPKVFFTDHHSRPEGYQLSVAPVWKQTAARMIGSPFTKVICVSDYGYRCMTSVGLLRRDRYQMIYNGVDLSRVATDDSAGQRFRQRFSIPEDRQVVMQVSWMIPEKGISDFLKMARSIATQRQDVQFVLVGDGAYREQYMKDAEAMGLGDRITLTGVIDDPFGAGVFHAADVVCQFSRWEEVFGWMIAEAMAHAKPVVATRVGGIPELIGDGVSGYLVDRGDTEAMSQRVLELLDDRGLRIRMGEAGRATVKTKFNLQRNVSQLIEAYGVASEART
jgi:glycosyltransferase involved in cell wall biosynthesis